jgi:hypothetical protein
MRARKVFQDGLHALSRPQLSPPIPINIHWSHVVDAELKRFDQSS